MDLFATLARLDALGLPRDAYAVFGSGPLAARGLRPAGDLDIVVLPALWTALQARFPLTHKGEQALIALDDIEIWPNWHPASAPVADLVAGADPIAGYRFVNLDQVLIWKRALGRPKDLADIALITAYLRSAEQG